MALHEHAAQVVSAVTIDEIVTCTLDAMEFGVKFDFASVSMIEGSWLLCKGTRGIVEHARPSVPLNRLGVMAKAVKCATTIHVADTRREKCYVDPTGIRSGKNPTMLSELAVPVIVDKKPVAILNVESTSLDAFTDEDQRLLETLATHVASELKRLEQTVRTKGPLAVLSNIEERHRSLRPVREFALNIVENIFDTLSSGGELTITAKESHLEMKLTSAAIDSSLEDLGNKVIVLGVGNCRRAIEAHGGSIRIERAMGRGTALTVNFPANIEIVE